MLVGFVALIAFINAVFKGVIGISFQEILVMHLHHLHLLWVYLGMKQLMPEILWQQN